jgi:hypothetical protein
VLESATCHASTPPLVEIHPATSSASFGQGDLGEDLKIRIKCVMDICPYCPSKTRLSWCQRQRRYEWLLSVLVVSWHCDSCGRRFLTLGQKETGFIAGVVANREFATAPMNEPIAWQAHPQGRLGTRAKRHLGLSSSLTGRRFG